MSAGNQVATKQRRKSRKLLPTEKALLQEIRNSMRLTINQAPEIASVGKRGFFYQMATFACIVDDWANEVQRHAGRLRTLTGADHVEEILLSRRRRIEFENTLKSWRKYGHVGDWSDCLLLGEGLTPEQMDAAAEYFKRLVNQIRRQLAESN